MGTPKAKIGITKEIRVACLKAPSRAIIANIKPAKFAPESPINIFAGNLLYFKNPNNAAKSSIAIIAESP